ncbi:HU family DNA-binding protein [Nannocystis sp.]|uniref:HU family DNA-binding protein n=1 Tax=Nannocystis sp. TaxID=1962667 RepID=UPI0025E33D5B|nr:HU family DNA-binding protein [Nannocystis sp.]MBK7823856.1 HU family DNA-binding protein [Nannocystis sp.]
MTKAELIEKIARSRELPPDVTKKCIGQILDLAFEELGAYFVRARVTRTQCPRFTFPAFGTFTKKKRSARKGINPRTLEPMTIDAAFTIDFRPGTELRQHLNLRAAPMSAGKGKRGTASSVGVDANNDSERLTLLPGSPELNSSDDDDDDAVPIERRRFTHRDDLLDDDDDELGDDPMDGSGEPADGVKYDLAPAPMQRARVRGASSTRTGS